MSRRSRKRGHGTGASWLGKAALGVIVCGVIGAGVLYSAVRGYLHSDGFRRFLSEKVSAAAGVEGEFTPFRWDGLAVDTAAFEAASGGGVVKQMRLDGLHTEVGVGGLGRGVWEIQGSEVQRLEVTLDTQHAGEMPVLPVRELISPQRPKANRWLPSKVEFQGLKVHEVVLKAQFHQGTASVEGMRMRVEPGGKKGAYRLEAADGVIRLPFAKVPELRLDHARLRYQDGQVFLSSAQANAWKDGRLEASGEWDRATGHYALEGDISGVKCEEIFNEDWSKRFTGNVSSHVTMGNHGGSAVARGNFTIHDGTLTALPVLDALAAYADTRRFRVLALSEARTDWRWKHGELFLSNLVLASEGLVRLEGGIFIRGQALDGSFRLGVAPGTLASIPGAETHVFAPGERGLLWAPLRITGTLDDPKEDLTDRLVAAAGLRMFDMIPETGEKVIKFTQSVVGESPSKAVEQGIKIIEEGAGIAEDVGGILDGILGGGRRNQPEIDKEDR